MAIVALSGSNVTRGMGSSDSGNERLTTNSSSTSKLVSLVSYMEMFTVCLVFAESKISESLLVSPP